MPRHQREDIQVNVAGLRRNIKNLAHNYSDAQIKVREATSNDPWGPSSSLMSDIADLTYNVVAFTEIMQMIWKRLNDSGKNWRHVYKALSLLEYLIKTGSDKVASQCKENIFVIQTLRDFQYLEDGKDQGFNVREKAKTLVTLLEDEERLKNERARQLKARERFQRSTSSGFGSEGSSSYRDTRFSCNTPSGLASTTAASRSDWTRKISPEELAKLESARPQTAGEEELQLQLALAMSREEAEQEEQKKKSDEVRLQLALSASQSENEIKHHLPATSQASAAPAASPSSHMLDLLEVEPALSDPWALPTTHAPPTPAAPMARPQVDPWSCPAAIPPADPWAPLTNGAAAAVALPKPATATFPVPSAVVADPWSPVPAIPVVPATNDPWSLPPQVNTPSDDFDEISNRNKTNGLGLTSAADPFDVSTITDSLRSTTLTNPSSTPLQPVKKTPHSFLGENSALVNLDNLITVPPAVPTLPVATGPGLQAQKTGTLANPFGLSGAPSTMGQSAAGFTPFSQHHQPQQPSLPSPANPFLS
ncbi:hypothetical protein WDU94_007070 [Cyamophila willieti]